MIINDRIGMDISQYSVERALDLLRLDPTKDNIIISVQINKADFYVAASATQYLRFLPNFTVEIVVQEDFEEGEWKIATNKSSSYVTSKGA